DGMLGLGTAAVSGNSRISAAAKFFFEGDRKFFVKGITYGPFKPDAEGNFFRRPDQLELDLRLMRGIGLNVLRGYHVPLRWVLACCATAGMRVLVTLPWQKHIEFLRERKVRDEITRLV